MHYVLLLALLILSPLHIVHAAGGSLYMSPERGTYSVGETFVVSVLADTDGQPISAAEAELTFNADALSVADISMKDSIMDSWPTPPTYSNDAGTIRFAGWTKEKYSGSDGLLISITFKALRNSAGNAQLAAGAILAADGVGTNIITSMKSGLYTVEPKKIQVEETIPATQALVQSDESATGAEEVLADSLPEIPSSFPTFISYDREVSVGGKIIVQGHSIPNSEVVVHFGRESEKDKEVSVVSSGDGTFTFVSDNLEREGLYHVKAAVMGADRNLGPFSETISLRIISPGVAASILSLANIAWTVVPLFVLLILIGGGVGYGIYRYRRVE